MRNLLKLTILLFLVAGANAFAKGCCQSTESNSGQKSQEYVDKVQEEIDDQIKPAVDDVESQLNKLKENYIKIDDLYEKQKNTYLYEYVLLENEKNSIEEKIKSIDFLTDTEIVELKAVLLRIQEKTVKLKIRLDSKLSADSKEFTKK